MLVYPPSLKQEGGSVCTAPSSLYIYIYNYTVLHLMTGLCSKSTCWSISTLHTSYCILSWMYFLTSIIIVTHFKGGDEVLSSMSVGQQFYVGSRTRGS